MRGDYVEVMGPPPRIGTRLRRAIERKRMSQADVADALHVSRSAVNAWVNDRAWPMNSIGALEDLLGIDLTGPEPRNQDIYTDPTELAIWNDDSVPPDVRRAFIAQLRAERAACTIRRRNPA